MAGRVARVLEDGGVLLAEAATGTGKTLAYLVPAILSRQRVLVSTGTKNLQEQIYFKDLPALREALDVPFSATLMKGRSNYLCLHRYELYRDGAEVQAAPLIDTSDRVLLPIIDAWLRDTKTGDRAELRDLPEDLPFWKNIAAEAETCLGSECPRYGDCFVTQMRQRAAESDVVIVNHHLLCADAAVRQSEYGEVIPSCATLVVDEAHQLEDIATQYFGVSFSSYRIDDLVGDGERMLGASAFDALKHIDISDALTRAGNASRQFFAGIALARMLHAATDSRVRYTAESMIEHVEDGFALTRVLEELETTLILAQPPSTPLAADADEPGAVVETDEARSEEHTAE